MSEFQEFREQNEYDYPEPAQPSVTLTPVTLVFPEDWSEVAYVPVTETVAPDPAEWAEEL